jgi:UDP-N-acetylmuramoyl-L-alanyl-D-glutamate--2,6-diaminopimelate ligase
VTGTNGKTSTVGLLSAALGRVARPVASVTTLGSFLDDEPYDAAKSHAGLLATMRAGLDRGGRIAVVEMTSEALARGYAHAWPCRGAVFTNLTHDHLDAHGSPEHYLASKAQLFMALPADGFAVLNGCDPSSPLLAELLPSGVRTLSYGLASRGAQVMELDVEALDVSVSWDGTTARLRTRVPGMPSVLRVRGIGHEHLENALAALCGATLFGLDAAVATSALAEASPRPGRFEVHGQGPRVVVDFAHSPDALARVLATAKSLCSGKLWVVFGAGGNRDRNKRGPMGVAARVADHVVLTSDNARDESPAAIAEAIRAGLGEHPNVRIELDRERAIRDTVRGAAPGDVVVLAGRGPETELLIGDRKALLADAEVAQRALEERGAR